jgi:DNA-binding NarL/FixJ family response regulator
VLRYRAWAAAIVSGESTKTVKVVLADDEPRVRSAMRLLLDQERTWEVRREVVQADELLTWLEHECSDVVLLDWELPGLVIEEVIGQLRSRCPQTWIVALSSRLESRSAALSAGVDAFVSKSDAPGRLLAVLRGIRTARDSAGGPQP